MGCFQQAVTPAAPHKKILPQVSWRELLEASQSLEARTLLETSESGLTQQPVIMEYVTAHFIKTIEREIIIQNLKSTTAKL